MSDCLAFNEWPSVLQGAAQRLPRKSPRRVKSGTRDASRQPSAAAQNQSNNYLAEARAMRRDGQTSPLGGRNRRGAGAPSGNRNANCRVFRQQTRLKKRLLEGRLHLLVLSAAVAHLENAFFQRPTPPKPKNLANNFVAEACPAGRAQPSTLLSAPPRLRVPTFLLNQIATADGSGSPLPPRVPAITITAKENSDFCNFRAAPANSP